MSKPTEFNVLFRVMFKFQLVNQAMLAIPFFLLIFLVFGRTLFWGWYIAVVMLLSILLGSLLATYLTTHKPRALLTPEGITVHNTKGKLQFAKWEDISQTKHVKRLGVSYMVFGTANEKPNMILPLFLEDMDGFIDLATEYAGSQNPLVVALEEKLPLSN